MIIHSIAMRSHVELHVVDVHGRVLASSTASPKLFDPPGGFREGLKVFSDASLNRMASVMLKFFCADLSDHCSATARRFVSAFLGPSPYQYDNSDYARYVLLPHSSRPIRQPQNYNHSSCYQLTEHCDF